MIYLFTIFLNKTAHCSDRPFQFHRKQRWIFRIVSIRSILYLLHFAFCCRTLSPMTHVKVSCRAYLFSFLFEFSWNNNFEHFFLGILNNICLLWDPAVEMCISCRLEPAQLCHYFLQSSFWLHHLIALWKSLQLKAILFRYGQ